MYDTVLFDLDGTLTDPGIGITNSVIYALAKLGIAVEDRALLYKFIGPPLYQSFMEFYGFDREQAEEAVTNYREYYKEKGIFENKVYEEIPELLESLKAEGKVLLIATSKPEPFAKQIAEHFGMAKYFDVSPKVVRWLFVLMFFAFSSGLMVYIILMIFMRKEPKTN